MDLSTYNRRISTRAAIVYFMARESNSCRRIGPYFESLKVTDTYNIDFIKINVVDSASLAQKLKVDIVPTFYIYHHGNLINSFLRANEVDLHRGYDYLLAILELTN